MVSLIEGPIPANAAQWHGQKECDRDQGQAMLFHVKLMTARARRMGHYQPTSSTATSLEVVQNGETGHVSDATLPLGLLDRHSGGTKIIWPVIVMVLHIDVSHGSSL